MKICTHEGLLIEHNQHDHIWYECWNCREHSPKYRMPLRADQAKDEWIKQAKERAKNK